MPFRPDDLAPAFLDGEDVVFGAAAFKAFWDRGSQPQDLGGDLAVMGVTEKLTYATASAPTLVRGARILIGTEGRVVREVRLLGDGAVCEAFLELP